MAVTRVQIPISPDNPHPLGRNVEHDDRSRQYGIEVLPTTQIADRIWANYIPILDQSDLLAQGIKLAGDPDALNSCTGNSGIGVIGSSPLWMKQQPSLRRLLRDRVQAEIHAVDLYASSTELAGFTAEDGTPDTYPPHDDGSTGLATAKAMVNAGYISSYVHSFSGVDGLATALQSGPAMIGTNWYECVVPGTRVLTADLSWAPVEKLSINDALIGFDEDVSRGSKYRMSTVVSNDRIVRPCVEVTTNRGTVTVSTNHLFVQRHAKTARNWMRADQLQPGDQILYFGDPWDKDESWEAGWLAGFYDGEGSLAGSTPEHRSGNLLTCSQLPGPTLDRALAYLGAKGYDYGMRINKSTGVHCWYLRGENAKCRFLGSIRPGRLLNVAERAWRDHAIFNKSTRSAVVQEIAQIGQQEVFAIGTTTGTLLTEGYLSHNSMFSPKPDGTYEIAGAVAGGHEYVCDAVYVKQKMFRFRNSWTPTWGDEGCFFGTFDQVDRLLGEQGDVILCKA